jgi:uncharacterized protein
MFRRDIAHIFPRFTKFPVLALLGPRQSGKTTLVQHTFPKHTFLSLDDDVTRSFALEDPQGFLLTHENEHGIILDEFQYSPKLTTYIKLEADKKKRPGYFILTGSQNFLVKKNITESLAGRVGIIYLYPLSNKEILQNSIFFSDLNHLMIQGCYPRIYMEGIASADFYQSYLASYIQRDVGQLITIKNSMIFKRFIQLCAGRIGQLCNVNSLAADAGISAPTAREWLSILQASYIIFFLEPHFKNFNKRLIKSPKLYFFDTGLASSLLRIDSAETLSNSHFFGQIFENFIIADLYKQYSNRGITPPLYFWRDRGGVHEIDCIIDQSNICYPIEIKSGKRIASDVFKGLDYWNRIAQSPAENSYLVYAGDQKQIRHKKNVIGWKDASNLVNDKLA